MRSADQTFLEDDAMLSYSLRDLGKGNPFFLPPFPSRAMHGLFTVKVESSFLYARHEIEEPSLKYILLRDRVGHSVENKMLSLGLTTKSTPLQILRGEILKGAPEADQPTD